MIELIIIFIGGCLIGGFLMWIATRPEPIRIHSYTTKSGTEVIDYNPKVDQKAWEKCMKECGAYYQDNGKIWDNETAVVEQETCYDGYVEKPKRIKHGKCKTNPNDPGMPYSEYCKDVKKSKKKKNDRRQSRTKGINSKTKK
jgi:hypothetical protein